MSSTTTPQKTDLGWVIDVPNEIARALSLAEGSIAILHVNDGRLEVEMLPRPLVNSWTQFAKPMSSSKTRLMR